MHFQLSTKEKGGEQGIVGRKEVEEGREEGRGDGREREK